MKRPEQSVGPRIDDPIGSPNVAGIVGFASDDSEQITLLLEILGWRVASIVDLDDAIAQAVKLVFVFDTRKSALVDLPAPGIRADLILVTVGTTSVLRWDEASNVYHLPWPLDLTEVEHVIQMAS